MRRFLGDHFEFLRQFRSQFESTGAIAPSSRFLARAMTRPFSRRERPVRILEIGPGTGAVTGTLVKLMRDGDHLDLVELNDKFVDLLRTRFQRDPAYQRVAGQSQLHHCLLQDFRVEQPYDYIISGLPLNNFPAALVREIFAAYFKMLAPGGVLSYFEYMYVRPMRRAVAGGAERQRLCELDEIITPYMRDFRIKRDWVFVNLPPAWVQHLRYDGVPQLQE